MKLLTLAIPINQILTFAIVFRPHSEIMEEIEAGMRKPGVEYMKARFAIFQRLMLLTLDIFSKSK